MTSSDWLTVCGWVICGLGALLSALIALVVYFLRRMVDQFDHTRKAVHALRNELHDMGYKFQLFRVAVRMLLQKAGVDMKVLDDLECDEQFGPRPNDGTI